MSKYYPLRQYLEASEEMEETLTFSQIENILGFKLPYVAYTYSKLWVNSPDLPMAKQWLMAGWRTQGYSLGHWVHFIKMGEPINTQTHTYKDSTRELKFENYMINDERKAQTTAYQYRKAINRISKHFSERTGQVIDIYKISDIALLGKTLRAYKTNGWFDDFGTARLMCKQALVIYIRFATAKQRTCSQTESERDKSTQDKDEEIVRLRRELENEKQKAKIYGAWDNEKAASDLRRYKEGTLSLKEIMYRYHPDKYYTEDDKQRAEGFIKGLSSVGG